MSESRQTCKTEVTRVRITPNEKAVLETAAKARGYRSVSDFTRAAWARALTEKPASK